MHRHQVVVGQVGEGRGIVDHGMRDHSTPMEIDGRACDPRREGFGDPLLRYRDPADPVGKPVHVYWTVAHMRQHPLSDAAVIVDQLAFRDPVVWEEEFVRMGDGDHVSVNGQHEWIWSRRRLISPPVRPQPRFHGS